MRLTDATTVLVICLVLAAGAVAAALPALRAGYIGPGLVMLGLVGAAAKTTLVAYWVALSERD